MKWGFSLVKNRAFMRNNTNYEVLLETCYASNDPLLLKFGQLLTMDDPSSSFFNECPRDDVEELASLVAEHVFEYGYFLESREPVAVGSIGTVFKVRKHSCSEFPALAVKCYTTKRGELFKQNLKTLELLCWMAQYLGFIDLNNSFQQMRERFEEEINYIQEGSMQKIFYQKTQGLVKIPRVHEEMTRHNILCTEFMEEAVPWNIYMKTADEQERASFCLNLFKFVTGTFLEHRLLFCDCTPGNFLIDRKTGELIVVDFGSTKEFSITENQIIRAMHACVYKNKKATFLGLLEQEEFFGRIKRPEEIWEFCKNSMAYYEQPDFQWSSEWFEALKSQLRMLEKVLPEFVLFGLRATFCEYSILCAQKAEGPYRQFLLELLRMS